MLGSSRQGIEDGQCYGLGGKQKLEEVAASSNGEPTTQRTTSNGNGNLSCFVLYRR